MSEPESVTQLIDSMLEKEKRDSSVTSILIAATPFPNIFWVSLHGSYNKVVEHHSSDSRLYPVSIPVAVLTPQVKRYRSRATVTLGMFRLLREPGTWKTWEVTNVQVQEDLNTHQVTVEFGLRLDGKSVAAGSFSYIADLYLGF